MSSSPSIPKGQTSPGELTRVERVVERETVKKRLWQSVFGRIKTNKKLCVWKYFPFFFPFELWHYFSRGTSIMECVNDASSPWIFQLLSPTSTRHAGAVPAQQLLEQRSAGARADLPAPKLWSQLVEQIAVRLGLDLARSEPGCCAVRDSSPVPKPSSPLRHPYMTKHLYCILVLGL